MRNPYYRFISLYKSHKNKFKTIQNFIYYLENTDFNEQINYHFRPQHMYVCNKNNEINIKISKFVGSDVKLSNTKVNITEKKNIEFYKNNLDIIDRIYNLYKLNFVLFGYEKKLILI